MSPDVPAFKFRIFTCDFKFRIGVLKLISVVDILTHILLNLLTFITLLILRKMKFGVSYYVNFQFTPRRVIN